MMKIKATALVIVLAFAGMVYAAGNMQETKQSPDKEKTAACCSTSGESCCAQAQKCCENSGGPEACGKTDKEGEACCAAMSKDAKACETQSACSCCKAHTTAASHSSQACPTDGSGCCANCGDCCKDCCKDGACCKPKVARQ